MAVNLRATTSGTATGDYIANEIPSGLVNSSNTVYTLANTPDAGTVTVHLNGMLQTPGSGNDYLLSGSTITFNKAPRTNSEILVNYIKIQIVKK